MEDDFLKRQDQASRLFARFVKAMTIKPTRAPIFFPAHKNRDVIGSVVWHVEDYWTVSVDIVIRPGRDTMPHFVFRVRDDYTIGPLIIGGPEESVVRRLVEITTELLNGESSSETHSRP